MLMLSKRYESTEVDRRTWLHVPWGTHWSTRSDTHQEVEIQIETSTKMFIVSSYFSFRQNESFSQTKGFMYDFRKM